MKISVEGSTAQLRSDAGLLLGTVDLARRVLVLGRNGQRDEVPLSELAGLEVQRLTVADLAKIKTPYRGGK